jgi:pimeloyl-ACP methyl ester carboxylesterase
MNINSVLGISEEGFHKVAYAEWGSSSTELPTVLCVHGYTRNGRDFDGLANYLALKGRHIFCPDIVGRGDSSWFQHSHHYNFTQYVADMSVLIARTQAQQIDWIGTSMGGMIGMMMAALPNTPIRRLILNDIGPQIPIHGLRKLAKYIGNDPDFKSVEDAKQYFKKHYVEFGVLSEDQWDTFTEHTIEQHAANLYKVKADPSIKNPKSTMQIVSDFFHHPHKALEGIVYDIDLWSIWNKIHCPVLVIHGTHSELLTPAIIKKMLRTHSNTAVYEVTDAGHAPALLDIDNHETIENWLNATINSS